MLPFSFVSALAANENGVIKQVNKATKTSPRNFFIINSPFFFTCINHNKKWS
ncbi:hypothetical protein NT03LS_3116 [Listeria seeligeri FSL N1-067]|uniref:Uncharacterized protein n=1 Tax=Listeria seeligeri FSL N1-067 TaxID=702453 RepID=E3ZU54_LISSE|nr:hypothetical protein NT03LS_3116 [Listeria seeligeri FSL N1-067]